MQVLYGLHRLKIMCEPEGEPMSSLCRVAALNGQINVLKFLHGQGYALDKCSPNGIAQLGHLEILKYLRQQNRPWKAASVANSAARAGKINVLDYVLTSADPPLTPKEQQSVMNNAGVHGQLEACKWLNNTALIGMPTGVWSSADMWPLNTMQWAIENGGTWGDVALIPLGTCGRRRRQTGKRDAWTWAHAHNVPCDCNLGIPVAAAVPAQAPQPPAQPPAQQPAAAPAQPAAAAAPAP
jgi:hypothetical protein